MSKNAKSVEYISKAVKLPRAEGTLPRIFLANGGRVRLREWLVSLRCLPLWHVYWNPDPGGRLHLADYEVEMSPDCIYLLPSYLAFSTSSTRAFRHIYLDFCVEGDPFSRVKKKEIAFPVGNYRWLLEETFKDRFSPLIAGSLILALLAGIPEENFVPKGTPTINPHIQSVLDMIFESFQKGKFDKLDNITVSRKLGISLANYQHLFRRELKISPHRYILNRRLELAYNLLKNTDMSIEEIAESAGFANRYQFSKSFGILYNIPPGRFRKTL